MRLGDKRAIVTGGASGFGRAIAEYFVREGAEVAIFDLNEAGARSVAQEIGGACSAFACDVASKTSVDQACAAAIEKLGGLDIVINNAGTSHTNRPMLEVDEEEFDRVMAVNVKSIFLMTHATLPTLRAGGGGVILNVGSTAGIRPRPGLAWYNASKGAVNLLSRSMAVELAPEHIRVCCIAPVAGATPLLATFMGGADTPEARAKFEATIPWGRLSRPEDIAAAAVFLVSDEAEMLTGSILEVDGGRCI